MKKFITNSRPIDGYDIGLLWLDEMEDLIEYSYRINQDETIERLNLKIGDRICLIGYPWEYNGALY